MSTERPAIYGPDGKPMAARRCATGSDLCPQCRAPRKMRVNAGGYGDGPPTVCCSRCGYHFEGVEEP